MSVLLLYLRVAFNWNQISGTNATMANDKLTCCVTESTLALRPFLALYKEKQHHHHHPPLPPRPRQVTPPDEMSHGRC